MIKEPLVILASARKQSDTRKLIDKLFGNRDFVLLDLLDYEVYPYQYENNYPASDKFLELLEVVLQHEQLIFATPVYWYAMSGPLKVFFDRLTDIVTVQKPLGRRMAGKEAFVVAVGSDPVLPEGFEVPFKLTCHYFDMQYKGCYYAQTNALIGPLPGAVDFMQLLKFN
ncbi:NAD(P)H-dependent oxidoreductase [uncultured Pontibacter sp.]|uniref:flavodoxin family protein n=1 Tax=uncultured Pontibacter sp. TaxID=453356 RepID=UPI00261F6A6E|nr:NAD(P)H-dependent oxidoreductase [uncultured Pontibacter sp.]